MIKIDPPNGEAIKKAYDMIHDIVPELEECQVYLVNLALPSVYSSIIAVFVDY